MDVETLKTMGQIAGIGGLALGVVLLLFRDMIRKQIFPHLTKAQAFRFLTLMAVLVWSIGLAGIGAWVWTGASSAPEATAGDRVGTGVIMKNDAKIEDSEVEIRGSGEAPANNGDDDAR